MSSEQQNDGPSATRGNSLPRWAWVSIITVSVLVVLSGIYSLIGPWLYITFGSPPVEERYYYINSTLEAIDYESAGTVVESGYDGSTHWMSRPEFRATIEGTEAFEILSENILESGPGDCGATDETVRCVMTRPRIDLINNGDDTVLLVVSDSGSGK